MAIPVASRATYLHCALKIGFWPDGDTPPTSFYDPVNWTKLEITGQTQESDDLPSNMEGSIGENLASVNKPTESAKMEGEANYMPPVLYGLLLGADISEIAQTTAPVVDETVTLAVGLWVPLANKYIEASGITLKTPADATVDPANYDVDLINGLIKAKNSTGATGTKLSYTKSTRAGERYEAGKAKSSYVKLIGTATEEVSKKRCRIAVHKVNLAGNAAFDPVSGTYVNGKFAGKLLTPTGENSPWTYEYLDLTAT